MKELLNKILNTNLEHKVSLLPQALEYGEIGINFLIECLNDSELKVRAKAYKLLQNIDSEPVRNAIKPGLLLNPGDRIYSVYLGLISFTDDSFLLSDDVYYLGDLHQQIFRKDSFEKEQSHKRKCIYCYLDKEHAEQKAEVLHRKLINKYCIGICGFEWKQKNPDFDLKRWCLDNNLLSEQEWDQLPNHQIDWRVDKLIRESNDRTLVDKFHRSKFIYHAGYIDIWCQDNQVSYDLNLDNWENLQKLLNYLDLPENIELLSKFWKDGVGQFAFVKEEFVQQKVYIRIGEKLVTENNQDSKTAKLIAKPENYEQEASNYLIEILNNQYSQPKHKLKAYELLKNFNTESAKQAVAQGNEHITIESVFDMGESIELNAIRLSWDGNPF